MTSGTHFTYSLLRIRLDLTANPPRRVDPKIQATKGCVNRLNPSAPDPGPDQFDRGKDSILQNKEEGQNLPTNATGGGAVVDLG